MLHDTARHEVTLLCTSIVLHPATLRLQAALRAALVVLNCLAALLPVSRCCVSNCTLCQAQAAVQSTTQFGTVQSTTQFGIASAAPSQPLVPLVGGAGAATVTSPSAETIAEVTITNPEAMKKSNTSPEVVVPTHFQVPVPVSSCCTSLVAV